MPNYCYFQADNNILIIIPYTPTAIISDQIWPIQSLEQTADMLSYDMDPGSKEYPMTRYFSKDCQLSASEFTQLCYQTREFRVWLQQWVQQGGMVIAQLLPQINIRRTHHTEWQVSNYDWLWESINLRLYPMKETLQKDIRLTEFGQDSPWREYLTEAQMYITVYLEGCHDVLATSGQKAIAGIIRYGQGKIILVPYCHPQNNQELWQKTVALCSNPESWARTEDLTNISPNWLESALPNLEPLKTSLQNYQTQITQLQEQCLQLKKICDQIQEQVCQQGQIKGKLFCGTANELQQGLLQWLLSSKPSLPIQEIRDNCLYYKTETISYLIMPVVGKETVSLWWGRRLYRLLQKDDIGIIVANAYRHLEPQRRPTYFSKDLIEFAETHRIILVSLPELLASLEAKNIADIFVQLQNIRGIVNL